MFRQSLQQWEWLIVNDASTQGGGAGGARAISKFRPQNSCDRSGGQRRAEPRAQRRICAGARRYVLQLDSDNLLEPTAAEKWWWFLETHPRAAFVKGFSVGFGAQTYLWRDGFHNAGRLSQLESSGCHQSRSCRRAPSTPAATTRRCATDWRTGTSGCAAPPPAGGVTRCRSFSTGTAAVRITTIAGANGTAERARRRSSRPPGEISDGQARQVSGSWQANLHRQCDVASCATGGQSARKARTRLLLIVPWLAMGGSDKFNLDLVEQLAGRGWEITIATTLDESAWLSHFTRFTPDVFTLPAFLRTVDYPRFLLYLLDRGRPTSCWWRMPSWAITCCHSCVRTRRTSRSSTTVTSSRTSWNDGGYPRLVESVPRAAWTCRSCRHGACALDGQRRR